MEKEITVTLNNGKTKKFTAEAEMVHKNAFFVTGPRGGTDSLVKGVDGFWYLASQPEHPCAWEITVDRYIAAADRNNNKYDILAVGYPDGLSGMAKYTVVESELNYTDLKYRMDELTDNADWQIAF